MALLCWSSQVSGGFSQQFTRSTGALSGGGGGWGTAGQEIWLEIMGGTDIFLEESKTTYIERRGIECGSEKYLRPNRGQVLRASNVVVKQTACDVIILNIWERERTTDTFHRVHAQFSTTVTLKI